MSDQETITPKKAVALTAAIIRRRMEEIENLSDIGKTRKRRNALAQRILRQISTGKIQNPSAAAKAYIDALPKSVEKNVIPQ